MALKATIFKASLQIADIDRHHYQTHALTIARHPSETDERMMVRLIAYARHADDALTFGKGLSDADEADLWQRDLTGAITSWIEVGQPDERRILKACGRAAQVIVYAYGASVPIWWDGIRHKLDRLGNLTVLRVPADATRDAAALARRTMQLQCTIQDGAMWLGDDRLTVQVECAALSAPAR